MTNVLRPRSRKPQPKPSAPDAPEPRYFLALQHWTRLTANGKREWVRVPINRGGLQIQQIDNLTAAAHICAARNVITTSAVIQCGADVAGIAPRLSPKITWINRELHNSPFETLADALGRLGST